ncbi:MAG: glycine betaine ABC transporter substrate-binding protein, partial [Kiloniellales bacterium]
MKESRFKARLAFVAVAAALTLGPAGPAQAAPESKDPIKLTIHDWTGQYVTTHIMAGVLESMGYNIELVTADY